MTGTPPFSLPGTLRFDGLDERKRYRIRRAWPTSVEEFSVSALSAVDGEVFAGDVLSNAGLQLPLMHPETILVLRFDAVD